MQVVTMMGVAAVLCCLLWACCICPALARPFGGDPNIGTRYRDVLAIWRDTRDPPRRLPVTVVVLTKPSAEAPATGAYTIPANAADRVFKVMWVDANGDYRGRDSYFRVVAPLQLPHAGVLGEYPNFYAQNFSAGP